MKKYKFKIYFNKNTLEAISFILKTIKVIIIRVYNVIIEKF